MVEFWIIRQYFLKELVTFAESALQGHLMCFFSFRTIPKHTGMFLKTSKDISAFVIICFCRGTCHSPKTVFICSTSVYWASTLGTWVGQDGGGRQRYMNLSTSCKEFSVFRQAASMHKWVMIQRIYIWVPFVGGGGDIKGDFMEKSFDLDFEKSLNWLRWECLFF